MPNAGILTVMDDSSRATASNPWSSSTTYVNLGSIQRVLTLAEKYGHLDRQKRNSDEIRTTVESYSSIKMIKVLGEITDIGQELDKVNLEIHRHLREAETRDVTHADVLGQRIQIVDELAHQMARIMEKKDELIKRLQQPFVGEYLEMGAAYHRNTAEVFPLIATNLAALPTHLDNISWAKNFSLADGQLASVLSSIESSLAELQSYFQSLCQSRKAMHQLTGKDIDDTLIKI